MNSLMQAAISSAASLVVLSAATLPAYAQAATPARLVRADVVVPAHEADTRTIMVSLEDRRLALVEDGVVKAVYPVAVGKASTPSPTGSFTIVARVANPTYYHDGKVIPPGPGNPVGDRWMGLSKAGYGIHGTNAPRSIGKAASHGCIRMGRRDLEKLFAQVRAGDTVEIVGQRDAETVAIFGGPAVTPGANAAAPVLTAKAAAEAAPAGQSAAAEATATVVAADR